MDIKELLKSHTLGLLAGGFAIGLVAAGIGSAVMSVSGSPEFCGTCHAMKTEAATFAMSPHRGQDCVECHLPHDNAAIYFIEKGRTGMVDMYHEVMRDYPAHIILSKDSRQMVDKNCIRCHEATMSGVHVDMKNMDMDSGADCLKCHKGVAHPGSHLEGGIKVE